MSDTLKKLKMLNGWILVENIDARDDAAGKILLPQNVELKKNSQQGNLVKIGKGADKNLKIGDVVLFRIRIKGKPPIGVDGKEYLNMKTDAVIGVMFGPDAKDVAPTRDHILLEWEFASEFYPGTNIRRPPSDHERHYTGLVIGVGPDVKECKSGDRVFFDQFCGLEKFEEDGKRLCMVTEKDLIATGLPNRAEEAVPA